MQTSPFRLVCDGSETRLLAGDLPVLRFRTAGIFYTGAFHVADLRLHPQSPPRIRFLKPPWSGQVPPSRPQKVRIHGAPTPGGFRVRLEPEVTGAVTVEDAYEFQPDPATGGWTLDRRCRLVFRRDVEAGQAGLFVMPDPRGAPACYWEFDDPLPMHGAGPGVPMREDWLDVFEPEVGPDTFRRHWRKEVDRFVFQQPSGKVRTIRFHRALTTALLQYNRRAVAVRRGGFSGFLCADGSGVIAEYSGRDAVFTHLCEWGNDIHFWKRVAGDPASLVLRKGQALEAAWRYRELPPQAMTRLLRKAAPLEPTAAEWKRVDFPLYEEPVNRFQTSWKDDPAGDGQPWLPLNGATWDRRVGRTTPGSLRVTTSGWCTWARHFGWKSYLIGPSTWMNPFVPGARYRVSGFVKVRSNNPAYAPMAPSLSLTFDQYAGPGTYSPPIQPAPSFSGSVKFPRNNLMAMRWKPGRWYPIDVVSAPISGNVLSATIGCHLSGDGDAWFDEIRLEKLP